MPGASEGVPSFGPRFELLPLQAASRAAAKIQANRLRRIASPRSKGWFPALDAPGRRADSTRRP